MANITHTPGPYEIQPDDEFQGYPFIPIAARCGDGQVNVCEVCPTNVDGDDFAITEQDRATARLFAAAPDSHRANKAFVAAIISEHRIPENASDDYIYDTIGSALASAFFAARAAIAKAERAS